ncbi:hypothetical protein TNCV_2705501 [Trichonephila clavipes]|nr:hypothetical protein TNCV_2705501 [Trichonephila clavipes]
MTFSKLSCAAFKFFQCSNPCPSFFASDAYTSTQNGDVIFHLMWQYKTGNDILHCDTIPVMSTFCLTLLHQALGNPLHTDILELQTHVCRLRVQTILAAVSDFTLNKAADIADRILEVSPSPIETFAVFNKKEQTLESKLFREIEKLKNRSPFNLPWSLSTPSKQKFP